MPLIQYNEYKPRNDAKAIIEAAAEILREYTVQGYQLTLRQLYYQFVARDLLANSQQNYTKLGTIISKAREAGLINWDYLKDRGRALRSRPHWASPASIISACSHSFAVDHWVDQPYRVEVWCEKEALVDVCGMAAEPWDVPYFACKGYCSATAVWEAGHNRFLQYANSEPKQKVVVLYLGDHDPSGINMAKDLQSRLNLFSRGYDDDNKRLKGARVEVRRIALNMDQIELYEPPPNPAKETDTRYAQYMEEFGITTCWELDALEPQVINGLIQDAILDIVDKQLWDAREAEEQVGKQLLKKASDRWDDIVGFLDKGNHTG